MSHVATDEKAGNLTRGETELDRLARARANFAFETTLSGLVHLRRLERWKASGYRIEIIFLSLPSPQLALRRIAARVRQGGHNVHPTDVLRRFERGWNLFQSAYRMHGRCMITLARLPDYWSKDHENKEAEA